jgi:hypothetical protein
VSIESSTGQIWHDSLEVLVNSSPRLLGNPNPVANSVNISLMQPIDGVSEMDIQIIESQGNTKFLDHNLPLQIDLPVAYLNTGIYQLIARYGKRVYTRLFTKL